MSSHEIQDPHFLDTDLEKQIDQTLRMIGSTHPRPGIETRIAARLADAPVQRPFRVWGLPRLALASVAGMAACLAIIAGSVNHSRHMVPIAPGIPIPMSTSSGVGTAEAGAVTPKPVAAPAHGRARSVRKTGVASDGQKPNGVAVPKAPLPQSNATPPSQ
jgi:hypothetical protein